MQQLIKLYNLKRNDSLMKDYYNEHFIKINNIFMNSFKDEIFAEDFQKSAQSFYKVYQKQNFKGLYQFEVNAVGFNRRIIIDIEDLPDLFKLCSNESGIFFITKLMEISSFFSKTKSQQIDNVDFLKALYAQEEITNFKELALVKDIETAFNLPRDGRNWYVGYDQSFSTSKFVEKISAFVTPTIIQYFNDKLGMGDSLKVFTYLFEKFHEDIKRGNNRSFRNCRSDYPFTLIDVLQLVHEISEEKLLEDYPVEWLLESRLGV